MHVDGCLIFVAVMLISLKCENIQSLRQIFNVGKKDLRRKIFSINLSSTVISNLNVISLEILIHMNLTERMFYE